MLNSLRSLVVGSALMLGATASAQYPYWWTVNGSIAGCYPGQVVTISTIQGTMPQQTITATVDSATCTFSATLGISSVWGMIQLNTLCGGVVINDFDTASFNFFLDTAYTNVNWNCGGGGQVDCNGVMNGPDVPGAPCDDGDPNTTNDTWLPNCTCVGFQGGADVLIVTGQVSGCNGPTPVHIMDYWTNPALDTIIYTDPNCGYSFTYNPSNSNQGWVMVEASCDGGNTWMWDSLGYSFTGIDSAIINFNCGGFITDCMGVPNGPNMPGTLCDDGDTLTVQDTWNANCVCTGVVLNAYDCNGVLNGPDMPGTPCDDNDPLTSNDMWDANCLCAGSNNAPCQAGFWVMQGYTLDSLNNPQPIPNELWIWNLSSGGSGTYTYFWSFGDGTSSTDPFPTHQYANGGPYLLCLTIDDGAGCTSTSCDSISVDSNGLYTGFSGGNNQRDQGFTINVQNGIQSVGELNVNGGLATWPNPATDELNIAIADAIAGNARIEMVDASGHVVMSEQTRLAGGRSQFVIGTQELAPGLYMLRISNGERVLNQRIVKGN